MDYLAIEWLAQECVLTLYNEQQVALDSQTILLPEVALEVALEKIITGIKEINWAVAGGVLDYSEFLTKEDGTTIHIGNDLSEQLNYPVVSKAEFDDRLTEPSCYFFKISQKKTWELDYYGYTPGKSEYSVESLLTIGNGYLGLRGTLPEMEISENHYPGTYLAGLYNATTSLVAGKEVVNEDFVNCPNFQYLSLKIGDSAEPLEITTQTVKYLHRQLHLNDGLFQSEVILEDSQGRQVKIKTKRLVNMADKHQYSLHYEFTPLNFSEKIQVISKSDGSVYNFNVERYRSLERHHLTMTELKAEGTETMLAVTTKQSDILVLQRSCLVGDFISPETVRSHCTAEQIIQEFEVDAQANQAYQFEKNISIHTFSPSTHEAYIKEKTTPTTIKNFQTNYSESKQAWKQLWQQAEIVVSGDLMSQKLLHLHSYHLLISGSPTTNQNLDVSITARGLHGEAYRGHIFWDELFILPFYILHFPEAAKQLLMYRYHRLNAAKKNAQQAGYSGAMFPWQSGLEGTEQTQEIHLNPLNGQWGEDYSRLQRHVSLAIAYNVWLYWTNTNDQAFMNTFGGELMLEIAEFWRSKTDWNPNTQRYDISKVMGPDEFHEGYPDSEAGGLKNNAYTTMMVVWLFEEIEKLTGILDEETFAQLQAKTGVTTLKISEMMKIRQQLTLEINPAGIIAQFAGYFKLKEIDWEYYRKTYGNIYRMDRILKANGESADDYKVAKQADTLMTFYNLSKEKTDTILADLGYILPADYLLKNLDYYLARTSHGSTLSRIVHAKLAEMVGKRELSWELYQGALRSDYQDIQGGTTAEGIHTGVMAATLDVTLTTYGGLEIRQDQVAINPDLPAHWRGLAFKFQRQGVQLAVEIDRQYVKVMTDGELTLIICGHVYTVVAGEWLSVGYR